MLDFAARYAIQGQCSIKGLDVQKGEYQKMDGMTWKEWFTILLVCGIVGFIIFTVLVTIFI